MRKLSDSTRLVLALSLSRSLAVEFCFKHWQNGHVCNKLGLAAYLLLAEWDRTHIFYKSGKTQHFGRMK